MKIGPLLDHLRGLETALAAELRAAAERHGAEHDVHHQCRTFAVTADRRAEQVEEQTRRYGGVAEWGSAVRAGGEDVLEDLRALFLRTEETAMTWTMTVQAAMAARDEELLSLARRCQAEAEMQAKWFTSRIKTGAPQALVVE